MATPNRSAAFSTVLSELVARLNLVLERPTDLPAETPDTYVRVVIAPSIDYEPYRAEEGVHLVVYPPQPRVPGGGRCATLVQREVVVHVVSQSLLDQAGVDSIASAAHLDLEDRVVDSMTSFHPDLLAPGGPGPGTAVNVRWKGGASQQHRLMKTDAGLIYSALAFDISYAQPFTIPDPA